MQRFYPLILITAVMSLFTVTMEKRNRKADEAIATAGAFHNRVAQQAYLDNRARHFIAIRDYRNAKEIAEYVIYNINGESQTANDILHTYREKFEKGS